MPFYNFEVRTPTNVLLTDSAELANGNAARIEATKRIGELLRVHADALWSTKDWQMDVTNEQGLVLYVIQISALKSPGAGIKI